LLGTIYANKGVPKVLALPMIFFVIAPLVIPLEVYLFHPKIILHTPYLLPGTFISSLIIIHSLMGKKINNAFTPIWLNRLIKVISRNTLGIFCLNPLVIILLSYIVSMFGYDFRFFGHYIITPIISTTITLILSLGIIWILKKAKLGMLVTS
jgi:hypothetical protein